MNRPEYEFFNFFKKLNYFFSSNKIDFVLESLISDTEFVVKRNTIIKNQNNLNIFLKKGNNLIISNLSNSKIIAEEETNIFIYNSFTGLFWYKNRSIYIKLIIKKHFFAIDVYR